MSSGRFGVGYAHPSQEMDNTVFPPAHSAYGLELMTATKFPQWTNLKKPLLPVPSRGQLGWPPPTGSKNRFAWQTRKNCSASRQRSRCYLRFYPCTSRQWVQQGRNKSCWKIVQHGLSTATGWSSATEALGQDTLISPPCSHFQWWRGHTKSSRP